MAHSRARFQARSRRSRLWNQGPGGQTITSFASSTTSVLGLGQTSLGGVTIARVRGNLELVLTAAAAAGDGFHVGFGIGISTADAFSVGGVTSLPNPLDDMDWGGWIYHTILDIHNVTATIADGSNVPVVRHVVDSKAMRKMKPNETIWGSMQVIEDGTSGLEVSFDSRMLVLLA